MKGFLEELDRCVICETSYPIKEQAGVKLCTSKKCISDWSLSNIYYSEKFYNIFNMCLTPLMAKAYFDEERDGKTET